MKSFRNPEYLERYEDVVFELEQTLATPANGAHQTKTGHRIEGEVRQLHLIGITHDFQ